MHVAGCTPNPDAPCVTQQARQLTWTVAERPVGVTKFLQLTACVSGTWSSTRATASDGVH